MPGPTTSSGSVRTIVLLAALILLGPRLPLDADPTPAGADPASPIPLSEALDRLSRVAKLYRDSALSFSCDERITDEGVQDRSFDFDYVYVYSDVHGFADYRTDPRDPAHLPVRMHRYHLPRYLLMAYSWAFVFDESRQKLHRYEIGGWEDFGGRRALAVRFEPIPPYRAGVNDWFGTAWIDADSFQILEVRALKAADQRKQEKLEREFAKPGPGPPPGVGAGYLIEKVSTDFSVEKNGMRFPGTVVIWNSRYRIQEKDSVKGIQEAPVYRVTQSYTNYRFFNVRTEEEIRDLVRGKATIKPGP